MLTPTGKLLATPVEPSGGTNPHRPFDHQHTTSRSTQHTIMNYSISRKEYCILHYTPIIFRLFAIFVFTFPGFWTTTPSRPPLRQTRLTREADAWRSALGLATAVAPDRIGPVRAGPVFVGFSP